MNPTRPDPTIPGRWELLRKSGVESVSESGGTNNKRPCRAVLNDFYRKGTTHISRLDSWSNHLFLRYPNSSSVHPSITRAGQKSSHPHLDATRRARNGGTDGGRSRGCVGWRLSAFHLFPSLGRHARLSCSLRMASRAGRNKRKEGTDGWVMRAEAQGEGGGDGRTRTVE